MAEQVYDFRRSKQKTLLSLVTTSTTSAAEEVGGFSKIAFRLYATAISSGSGTFWVDVSDDASTWVTYNLLIDNLTNTAGVGVTHIGAKNFTSNTAKMVYMTPDTCSKYVRVTLAMKTDGSYTAVLVADTA